MPDGAGGYLLAHKEWPVVVRITSGNVMTLHEQLLPTGVLSTSVETEYLLAEDAAYAFVKGWSGGQARTVLIPFNPTTLVPGGPVPSTLGAPYMWMTHGVSSAGVFITGAVYGHWSVLGASVSAGWSSNGPTVQVATDSAVAQTEWSFSQGNSQRQNAPPRPHFVIVIPPHELATGPPVQTGATYELDFRRRVTSGEIHVIPTFYLHEHATAAVFKRVLLEPDGVVAFIGHSIFGQEQAAGPYTSYGFRLYDKAIVKRHTDPTLQPTWPPPLGNVAGPEEIARTEIVDHLDWRSKVLFVGSCRVGDPLKDLLKIADLSTDRAFIAPSDPTLDANLYLASEAWKVMARALSEGKTVSQAVAEGNSYLSQSTDPLRYAVYPAGAGNVKVR